MLSAAYKAPSELFSVDGDVLLWGPAGIAFTMTPEAAEETARRLLDAARSARMSGLEAFANGCAAREREAGAAGRSRNAA